MIKTFRNVTGTKWTGMKFAINEMNIRKKQNLKGWCGVSSHIKNIDKVLISRRGQLGSIDGHDCVSCVTITKWERYNKIKH